jgi:hypothetical protein
MWNKVYQQGNNFQNNNRSINNNFFSNMALFFKKVLRGNPSKPEAPKLWYPVLKSIGLVKEKQVAQLLSEETTLNPKEAEMTLYQLFKVIIRLLLDEKEVFQGGI